MPFQGDLDASGCRPGLDWHRAYAPEVPWTFASGQTSNKWADGSLSPCRHSPWKTRIARVGLKPGKRVRRMRLRQYAKAWSHSCRTNCDGVDTGSWSFTRSDELSTRKSRESQKMIT